VFDAGSKSLLGIIAAEYLPLWNFQNYANDKSPM
jgi:hypothetical protein